VCTWAISDDKGEREATSAFDWGGAVERDKRTTRRDRGEEDAVVEVEDACLLAPGALYVSVVYTVTALPSDNIKKEA